MQWEPAILKGPHLTLNSTFADHLLPPTVLALFLLNFQILFPTAVAVQMREIISQSFLPEISFIRTEE